MLSAIEQSGGRMVAEEATMIHRFVSISNLSEAVFEKTQHEKTVRLARLAMLIECEGSITIGMAPPSKTRPRPSLYPVVTITNTSGEITDEAQSTLNAEGIGFTFRPQRYASGLGTKMRGDVALHGLVRVGAVLETILPFLRSKKKQAETVLEFIKSRRECEPKSPYSDRDWELATAVRKLNGCQPQKKALDKAKACLESVEGPNRARTKEYFRKYVEMCTELQAAL